MQELFDILAALVLLPLWVGALFQLFGMPVAWLRLRKTPVWTGRPPAQRRIPLLAASMRPVTEAAVFVTFLAALALVAVHLVFRPAESETVGIVYVALVFGLPLVVAPCAVARLGSARLDELAADCASRSSD